MANKPNTFSDAVIGLGQVLSILKEVARNSGSVKAFVNFLGWKLPPGLDEIGLTGIDLTDFLGKLGAVLESSEAERDDELLMAARIADLARAMGSSSEGCDRACPNSIGGWDASISWAFSSADWPASICNGSRSADGSRRAALELWPCSGSGPACKRIEPPERDSSPPTALG